jgi:predicted aldo/keto reductase-like oxidoreductase
MIMAILPQFVLKHKDILTASTGMQEKADMKDGICNGGSNN